MNNFAIHYAAKNVTTRLLRVGNAFCSISFSTSVSLPLLFPISLSTRLYLSHLSILNFFLFVVYCSESVVSKKTERNVEDMVIKCNDLHII